MLTVKVLGSGCANCKRVEQIVRKVVEDHGLQAEVIKVTFDPAVISFKEILEVFFTFHDPTTLNRQGADSGTQYRSAIFYHSPEQKTVAESVKQSMQSIWDDPIVTEISPSETFYKAEDYHQNYYKDNPNQPYCSIVIAPKVKKFRQQYQAKLKQ